MSLDFLLIIDTIVFLINAFGIWLILWVYFGAQDKELKKWFVALVLSSLLWTNFAYLARVTANWNLDWSLICTKITFSAVPLFFITFYFFIHHLIKLKSNKFLEYFTLIMGLFIWFFIIFTDFIVKGVGFENSSYFYILGGGKLLFYLAVLFYMGLGLFLLLRNYFKTSKEKRLQIQYLLVGVFFLYVMNSIFNVFFPIFKGTIEYYRLGDYSNFVFLAFTAYAIVKRELFGIRLVLTTLLIALIAILLLLDAIVFTPQLWLQILKGFIFVIFLYFGYLLIQSVMREIHYRERLQKANKELKKLDRAKSEFISIASHQLRTPLSIVKGYVSMLSEGTYGNLPPRSQKPIKNVYKANQRLIKLVNDLLSLSRIESGKIEIKLEKASLQKITSNLVEGLKTQAHDKNIYLRFDKLKTSLPNILIDEAKIKEIISNLIDNAIKYTTEGGITVTLKRQKFGKQEKAVIEIKDTGLGMTKKEISKIFESFSRGKAGLKLYAGGAGLGLYIAKKFANMHGGDVKATSQGKSKGSTFYIELPIK